MDNNAQSPEPGPESGNVPEYSVSELSFALKRTVEGAYSRVRVRGEISGFKRAASGHLYMALKDDKANLDAVCWRGVAGRLRFAPEDGLEVVCTGRLSTYPARSRYQLVIDEMEPAGAGALMALLEERRRKLAAEGLFDAERKKPIPFLPQVIGVVTSPTGAVIRDILHRLADRFPRRVLLWPVLVQGEGAAAQIAAAVRGFNQISGDGTLPRPDLLIVARGGGSLEDLWAFNEEVVVRAVADSAIPLISAVGHETDTTLVDYAADVRAPTPTGAAEMAVPVRRDLLATVADLERRLERAVRRGLDERRRHAVALARALPRPRDLLALAGQRTDDLGERLPRALEASVAGRRARFLEVAGGLRPTVLRHNLGTAGRAFAGLERRLRPAIASRQSDGRQTLEGLSRMLESLGYRQVLARGYAVVRAAGGAMLARAATVRPGDGLDIEFADGHVAAVAGRAGVRRKKPGKGPADEQGTLL